MTTGNDCPSPQDAETCSDLGRDEQVYDYYNAVLVGDEARGFEAHLLDCFTCRRKLATLDWVNATLKTELTGAFAAPALEPPDDETETASEREHVATAAVGDPLPTIYVVVGGLSALGVLTLLGFKLVGYTRRRYARRVEVAGQPAG